ncbi:Xaa-Pro dipeptidyl-peptidase [Actinosynnema sp. NPDC047251]|uniref:Xaa-Pro dipeptidyl-peptidase n=1 Tax=Saccharothrix espanaensis (strain ATCC 51144 / DSM 44229 / JCM 9112 / NBRC 15066 / NRRL 15764) TaxID=1179773 RepID=K0JVY0_SACES|nr:Xaa-Pro dipeptidyl-peptidase [Saccharothrix espanaensis]CCH29592.1 putative Xaa-Pro dipeptidyl-peptidase [Saccharothrix espanaensis DSM 44229]
MEPPPDAPARVRRRHRKSLVGLGVVVLLAVTGAPAAGAPAASAVPPSAAAVEERVFVESTVDSDHDGRPDRIALDIARPAGTGRYPVVFEHSPYRTGLGSPPMYQVNVDRLPQEGLFGAAAGGRGAVRVASPNLPGWLDDYFVPRGYAVVLGHSIGTGASEGCPTSGDQQEALAGKAVVDWLNGRARGTDSAGRAVTASWSSGSVGMTGISYNGTLPNMVATTGVAGLKTIVPIAAQSSWYDYYRANGLVVAPGGYQGEDADVLAKAVVTRSGCADEIAALTQRQDRVSGDYNAFWDERNYTRQAGQVKASVFVMHGQGDWNVKGSQYSQWWEALRRNNVPRKIWLHRGGHAAPSRSDYQATLLRWFDYWLKGTDNGIMREPAAEVEQTTGWRKLADWPDPAARPTTLHLAATSATAPGRLAPAAGTGVPQSFEDQGRTRTAAQLAARPDTADPNRLVYRSDPLTAASRLSGVATVALRVAVENRDDANVTALLVDYGPVGSTAAPVVVTRGWIDPQNRDSASTGAKVVRGQEYDLRFSLEPKDHVFAAGRRIGLVVVSTDYDYTLRPAAGTKLRVAPGSSVTIPLAP